MIFSRLLSKLNNRYQIFKLKLHSNIDLGHKIYVRKRFNANVSTGKLVLGNNISFNNDCSINCHGKIIIGDNCIFGENVKMYDHNHVYKRCDIPIAKQGFSVGEIKIGSNCWIGSNVTILKGADIGDNVVIGANCLIYKSIPSNSVVKSQQELVIEDRMYES